MKQIIWSGMKGSTSAAIIGNEICKSTLKIVRLCNMPGSTARSKDTALDSKRHNGPQRHSKDT